MSQREQDRHHRATQLFRAADQMPPAARDDFLRAACADDPELFRLVTDLLAEAAAPWPAFAVTSAVRAFGRRLVEDDSDRDAPASGAR